MRILWHSNGVRMRTGYGKQTSLVWVDHTPCPPRVVSRLRHAHLPVAMSRFGQAELAAAGVEAAFIPHGVDRSVFCLGDRAATRAALGFDDDAFVVAMVQANKGYPSRKCFQEQFEGFARFSARRPEARLYLHSWEGTEFSGPNLARLAQAAGIADKVIALDPYLHLVGLPDAHMANIYRAADVTLNATGGEGFGVPIIESLACGTQVIVTDFSAMSELCPEQVGWRVAPHARFFTAMDAFQVRPDPEGIAGALERAFAADRAVLAGACRGFSEPFEAGAVASAWEALLRRVADEPCDKEKRDGRPVDRPEQEG